MKLKQLKKQIKQEIYDIPNISDKLKTYASEKVYNTIENPKKKKISTALLFRFSFSLTLLLLGTFFIIDISNNHKNNIDSSSIILSTTNNESSTIHDPQNNTSLTPEQTITEHTSTPEQTITEQTSNPVQTKITEPGSADTENPDNLKISDNDDTKGYPSSSTSQNFYIDDSPFQLYAFFNDINVTNDVEWSVNNDNATINNHGLITALKTGTIIVSANYNGNMAVFTIIIKNK